MTEAGIGRVLVASLHQGIADVLPMRLEFYENWLNPQGLRNGTIGLAPLQAVLSFLRLEGEAYHEITTRAGRYASEWTVASQSPFLRACVRRLPRRLRLRAALRQSRRVVHATYVGSRAIVKMRRDRGTVDVRGSLFCGTREPSPGPLCDFYAAAVTRFLELYNVPGQVRLRECRATGHASCILGISLNGRGSEGETSDEPALPA